MLVRPKRSFPGTALMIRGTTFADIWPLWAVNVAWAAGVYWAWEPLGLTRLSLTPLPFTLVGLALSIFLGFRNNACYDRWWEARKLWGKLVNTSRTIARQSLTLINTPSPELAEEVVAFRHQMIRRQIAYVYALKAHLRTNADIANAAKYLPDDEAAELKQSTNVPMDIAQRTGELYRQAWTRGWIHPLHLPVLEASLTDMLNLQGGCERIKNTPVPLSYTVLTHRLVGLYCLCLPFGIAMDVKAATPVVVALISYAFLGLDDVGSQLEDPFEVDANDRPLTSLARTIERNLLSLMDEPIPEPIKAVRGVLL